jgi:hypothetical protein
VSVSPQLQPPGRASAYVVFVSSPSSSPPPTTRATTNAAAPGRRAPPAPPQGGPRSAGSAPNTLQTRTWTWGAVWKGRRRCGSFPAAACSQRGRGAARRRLGSVEQPARAPRTCRLMSQLR